MRPLCHICGRLAVCRGKYEAMETEEYACGECCGHGNEDGYCVVLWCDAKGCDCDCTHEVPS